MGFKINVLEKRAEIVLKINVFGKSNIIERRKMALK